MRVARIAALGVALLAAAPGIGGTPEPAPAAHALQLACTAEMQRCLERLERRLDHGRGAHVTRREAAMLRLLETDPECGLLLQGTGLHGL